MMISKKASSFSKGGPHFQVPCSFFWGMYLHNKTKPQQLGFSHDGIHGFFGRFLAKFQGADFGRLVRSPKFHEVFLLCRGVFCPGKKKHMVWKMVRGSKAVWLLWVEGQVPWSALFLKTWWWHADPVVGFGFCWIGLAGICNWEAGTFFWGWFFCCFKNTTETPGRFFCWSQLDTVRSRHVFCENTEAQMAGTGKYAVPRSWVFHGDLEAGVWWILLRRKWNYEGIWVEKRNTHREKGLGIGQNWWFIQN